MNHKKSEARSKNYEQLKNDVPRHPQIIPMMFDELDRDGKSR